MRKFKTNASGDFRVKAYTGTNGVLPAIDLAAQRRQGLPGFAIQHKKGAPNRQWLLNSLTFPGPAHTLSHWAATPSNIAPIQKFRWSDDTVEANANCKFRVHPGYGTAAKPVPGERLEVAVTTDDGGPRGHRVIFNRAVAASQAFSRQFPELDPLPTDNKDLAMEDWPSKPRDWLQDGLLDQIRAFIQA